jgi:hypothetical protein
VRLLIWTSALEPFSVLHRWSTYAAYEPSKEKHIDVTQELVLDRQRHVGLNAMAWIV